MNFGYLLAKARYVPPVDLPFYAARYLGNRLRRFFYGEKRLAFWGPRLRGMDDLLKQYSLEQVCALQWQKCVEAADAALSRIPRDRVSRVRYEDFVNSPQLEFARICEQLAIPADSESLMRSVARVSNTSIEKGRKSLDAETIESVYQLIGETLGRYG